MTITIFSIISIIILVGIIVFILIHKPLKLGKNVLWFFIPIFIVGFVLHLCAVLKEENFPLYYSITYSIVLSVEMFTFSIEEVLLKDLIINNQWYSIALTLLYFTASFNTVLLVIILIKDFCDNQLKLLILRKKEHSIIVGSTDEALYLARLNPKTTILILEKPDRILAKTLIEEGIVTLQEKKVNNLFLKAGLLYRCLKTVIVMRENDNDNLATAVYLESFELYQTNVYVKYNDETDSEYQKISVSTKGKIHFFNLNNIVGRLFVSQNPMFPSFKQNEIKEIKAIFLGFGQTNKSILKNMVINNCFDKIKFVADIYDQNIEIQEERFKAAHSAIWDIEVLNQNEYYKFPTYPTNDTFKFLRNDVLSYSFKKILAKSLLDFNYLVIALGNDKLNISVATMLDDYFNLQDITNYKIFVKITEPNDSYTKRIFSETIKPFGNKKEILNSFFSTIEELDLIAKRINAFYADLDPQDQDKINEEWENLEYFEKESNRFSAYHIQTKLNIMNLQLVKDPTSTDILSEAEYLEILRPMRQTLGMIEHERWNAFHLMNNYLPMKKANMAVANRKIVRKNLLKKRHLCLTTWDELVNLENDSYDLAIKSGLDEETSMKISRVVASDFDVIDNLYAIISGTGYNVKKMTK